MQSVRIEYLRPEELKPYANNPRRNKRAVAGVAESIRRYGFVNPIIIDDKCEIVCGHTRLLAAQKLGMSEVPVIRVGNMTEDEVRAYRLADNKVAELASWDEEKRDVELGGINEDMTVFGFAKPPVEGIYQDEYNLCARWDGPEPKRGDVWLLGRHRLIVSNMPTEEALDALMNGQKADMLLCETVADFRQPLAQYLFAVSQHLKGGASFYLWHQDCHSGDIRGACRDAGLQVRQCLVWDYEKSVSEVFFGDGYADVHRPCLYGWMDGGTHLWASNRKQTTVLRYDQTEDGLSLPVPMISYCMENNTRGMDVVLDPFCHHGTSIIAAEQNGRICHAICPPTYAGAVLARFAALTGDASLVRCAHE